MPPNASFKPAARFEEGEELFTVQKAPVILPPDTSNMDAPGHEQSQSAGSPAPSEAPVSNGSGKPPLKDSTVPQDSAETESPPIIPPTEQPATRNPSLALVLDEDEPDSSSSSDSDPYAAARERGRGKEVTRKIKKKLRAARQIAKGAFIRDNGIIYVSEDHWTQCRLAANNCHLYAASTMLDMDSSMKVEDIRVKGHRIPPRFRIVNRLLQKELSRMSGTPSMNHDHVAPYRSIIRHDAKYRERLQELELQFNEMCQDNSSHNTVQLKSEDHYPVPDHLCYELSYHTKGKGSKAGIKTGLDDMEKTKILLDGFRTLIHFLDTDLQELVQDYYRIQSNTVEKLPFAHLWHLFTPGQEICTKQPRYQIHRVLQVTGGRKRLHRSRKKKFHSNTISDLVIDCFHLEFDGTDFNPVASVLRIKPYIGSRTVTSLPVYPLTLAKPIITGHSVESIADLLMNRGRKYEELSNPSHRRYKGLSVCEGSFDTTEEIDGDVMIDFQLAYRNKVPGKTFGGGVLETPTEEDSDEVVDGIGVSYDDVDAMRSYWKSWIPDNPLLQPQQPGDLSPESYRLFPATVYGYVLLSRKWYPLDIELVSEVPTPRSGDGDGFDKLVLPRGHKDIVRALVKTHARKVISGSESGPVNINSLREFDLVKGKGRGLIILLHGAPGVGKTSTAECVAANVGKPLFPITCGDIGGENAQEVEKNLENYFNLARKWDCVLLLDEADVFLSTREYGNIRQSSLVSVFLRVLEYYPGILILTTNRVGSFDEAIKSRLHCALYYPLLDEKQTFKIWQMNIKSLEEKNKALDERMKVQFKRKEIEDFARHHWESGKPSNRWNGRQIKNAFQTAVALADWDNLEYQGPKGPILKSEHFEKVAKASEHFDQYLKKTRLSDQTKAKMEEYRHDEYEEHEDSASDSKYSLGGKSGNASKKTAPKGRSTKHKTRTTKGKHRAVEVSSDEEVSNELDSEEESPGSASDDSSGSESEPPPPPREKTVKKHKKKASKA